MVQSESFGEMLGNYCSPAVGIGLLIAVGLLLALFAIFVLHTLTIWASADPEVAFHRARQWVGYTSSVWNSIRSLYNGAKKIAFCWVPDWNVFAKHMIEPAVWIGLDVASQIFTRKHYAGIIRDVDNREAGGIPFRGHYCGDPVRRSDGTIESLNSPTEETSKFCGFKSAALWAGSLGAAESNDPTNIIANGTTLLMSTAHARKLQSILSDAEIAALQADGIDTLAQQTEGGSMFPGMNLGPLMEAVQEITGLLAIVKTTQLDIIMHVAYTILSEVAILLFNLAQTLVRALGSVAMALFGGGSAVVKTLLKTGLDLLMILVIHVLLPLLFAVMDLFLCLINFIQPGTWPAQLKCVSNTCFAENGDIGAEIFTTFSSIPIVAKQIVTVIEALVNPSTGRKYGEAAEGSTEVPDLGSDAHAGAAAASCAACFTCRVPEVRAIWLLVAMTYGCVKDEQRFSGRIEQSCLNGGTFYVEACGPRDTTGLFLTNSQWGRTYTRHREFDTERVQHFAGKFRQLAEDEGGAANSFDAQRIADAWFKRVVVQGEEGDQAAPFYRAVCRQMRADFPEEDTGTNFANYSEGSMQYLTSLFLYESCKHDEGFELCSNKGAMDIVSGWHEVKSCLFDLPQCRREREQCLGSCGGNASLQLQDFATFAAKTEVSTRVLGTERMARGRANCNMRNHSFEVPLFDGIGEAWIAYASRLRVRGGFTAIDPRACNLDPKACATVQRVLEKDPTLTFVNGRFVPAHELTPPTPPPPPAPPPRFNVATSPMPSPAPPAPSPPPPWYAAAETCVPIATAAENDLEVADGLERAVCVYVRSVQDERVRFDKCFQNMPPSPPPPPPVPQSRLAQAVNKMLQRNVRQGGTSGPTGTVDVSNEAQYAAYAKTKQAEQVALLGELSAANPQLKTLLDSIADRVGGRRLWERSTEHPSHHIEDSILATEAFGEAPIMGIDLAECQALCEAVANETLGTCKGVAYARANSNPRDLTLRSCYLLRGLGGCTAGSFAAAVFTRRDTDGCTAPTERDNPMCVQLALQRTDMRVMTYDDTVSACRNGKGRPTVAFPKTYLEAFSMLGYARERGVHAFWSEKPAEGGTMVWTGLDGQPLVVAAGDRRCVLVSTVDTDVHGHMYAELKPCHMRLADGVVCESAQAFPPPPPGGTGLYPPPPPPPPPIGMQASMLWYTRTSILPHTTAICLAGMAEHDLYSLCNSFATQLAKPVKSGTMSSFMPMCQDGT